MRQVRKIDSAFDQVRKIKLEMTPEKLCVGQSIDLLPFTKEAFKIGFKEEPDYPKLKFLLKKVLLDRDEVPDMIFDWSRFPKAASKTHLVKLGEEELNISEAEEFKEPA